MAYGTRQQTGFNQQAIQWHRSELTGGVLTVMSAIAVPTRAAADRMNDLSSILRTSVLL